MVRANTNAQHAQQQEQHHHRQEMFSRTKSSTDLNYSHRPLSKLVRSAPHEDISPIEERMRGYGAINQEQQHNYDEQSNYRDEEQGQKSNR